MNDWSSAADFSNANKDSFVRWEFMLKLLFNSDEFEEFFFDMFLLIFEILLILLFIELFWILLLLLFII